MESSPEYSATVWLSLLAVKHCSESITFVRNKDLGVLEYDL